jgi:Domain of unknown function (DUF6438)
MKNILFALLVLLGVVACAKKTTEKSSQATTKPTTPVAAVDNTPKPVETPASTSYSKGVPEDIDANLRASLQKSPCFGFCGSFKAELFADGTAQYHGYAHVTRIGDYTAKVDAAFMKRITDKALSIKFLSLLDHYPTGNIAISDMPTTTTYVRIGNDGKRITNNYDPPKELTEFEQWLQAEFDGLKWEKK